MLKVSRLLNTLHCLTFAGGQSQLSSAGSSGLSDFLSGTGAQGNTPNGADAKTDLLGRALSSHKQDSFDFIGVSRESLYQQRSCASCSLACTRELCWG